MVSGNAKHGPPYLLQEGCHFLFNFMHAPCGSSSRANGTGPRPPGALEDIKSYHWIPWDPPETMGGGRYGPRQPHHSNSPKPPDHESAKGLNTAPRGRYA